MSPLVVEALGSIVRAGLQILAGYLVTAGIWQAEAAEKYVGAAALALISLGWSLWQKYSMRTKLVTALAMPSGASENQAKALIDNPNIVTPPVSTAKDAAPASIVTLNK